MDNLIQIEIIYIGPPNIHIEDPISNRSIFHIKQYVPSNTTIAEALNQSLLYQRNPETRNYPVGIFAKLKPLDTILQSGDRIEIYRPLTLDPKEKRCQRV